MSYKVMFVLNAIVALALGLAFLFVPAMVLDQFHAEAYASTVLIGRFFGTAMVALGLLLWFAKDVTDEKALRGMGIALFVGAVLGLIVNVIGVSSASGVIRSNGWITILVYAVFALGYGFLLFLKPRMKEE